MKPEIFRRCLECGASFRSGALFCPQCGAGTATTQAQQTTSAGEVPVAEVSATEVSAAEVSGPEVPGGEVPGPAVPGTEGPAAKVTAAGDSARESDVASTSINMGMATLVDYESPAEPAQRIPEAAQPLHPAVPTPPADPGESAGAGDTERKFRPGMQRLRKGTSIVIDEASYDPGLRFVLIAGILFLLFIVLLILSKWLG